MSQVSILFNKTFLISLMKLLKPYWQSSEKKRSFFWLFIAFSFTITGVRGSVWINNVNGDFFNALQDFNTSLVLSTTAFFGLALLVWTFSEAIAFYYKERLGLQWSRWLTQDNLKKWFSSHKHYQILLRKNIDNPDQRLSQDLTGFPILTITLGFLLLNVIVSFTSFGYVLWDLSSGFSLPLGNRHLIIPGYLFWCAFIYGIWGTWLTQRVGKKLSSMDFEQERVEADYRFSLVRARESAEQIALLNEGEQEIIRHNNLFKNIFINSLNIIRLKMRLNFCSGVFISSGAFVGTFIGLPLYFSKQIQLGSLMQISGAFTMMLSAFALLVQSFPMFAQWKSIVYRLTEFKGELDSPHLYGKQNITYQRDGNSNLMIRNLNIFLPEGKIFLNNINLSFTEKNSYLIKGNSGCGKSLFLKTLAGIWPYATGQIGLPNQKRMLFIPQNSYLPVSTIKAMMVAADSKINYSQQELQNILIRCRLEKYVPFINQEKNWQHILSVGEQQLLNLAKIFILKPDILVLDESTSALDELNEAFFYHSIQEWLPNLTLISVGHRESIEQFHQQVIAFPEILKKTKAVLSEMI